MGRGGALIRGLLRAALPAAFMALLLAPPASSGAGDEITSPVRYDRTYKCDLVARLPQPPELVIFGGSRAQRFSPLDMKRLSGHHTFNFAVQNSRPEDVYAMSRWLFWRAPDVKLHCVWALQATTLSDAPLHPGLLAEPRLAQFLPEHLVDSQRKVSQPTEGRQMKATDEYSGRGELLHNVYDLRVESGRTLDRALRIYLARMLPRAWQRPAYDQRRARKYFERTLKLYNLHDVEPVLVIMPYQPKVVAAFRAVGWGAREKVLRDYLESLQNSYDFCLLDYTELSSFGGDASAFYDGSHIKAPNARRILAQAVRDAPAAFR